MITELVRATIHGRVLIGNDGDAAGSSDVLVGFHGYGQTAADMMSELNRIPGASSWARVSVQALNRFYTRGDSNVVASWMTREDRDQAIADNIAYVDAAVTRALTHVPPGVDQIADTGRRPVGALVFVGFSQGAAMAYRAAMFGARRASGIIALAGDIPPELKTGIAHPHPWPKVLIGVGTREQWYSDQKLDEDRSWLSAEGVAHSISRFEGGHEWTDAFRDAAGGFLAALRK